MESKNKKLDYVSLGSVLAIIAIFGYFYSLPTPQESAEKKRDEVINNLNSEEKPILKDGIYSTTEILYETKVGVVDEFGRTRIFDRKQIGSRKVRFVFNSYNLIINYPHKWSSPFYFNQKGEAIASKTYHHVREIINFKHKWEYRPYNKTWLFFVNDWTIVNPKDGSVILDVSDYIHEKNKAVNKPEDEITIVLSFGSDDENVQFHAFYKFLTIRESFLRVEELIKLEREVFLPVYSANYRYPAEYYDIERYIDK